MRQDNEQIRPYALKDGAGWTYRFGIDFTVKIGEIEGGSNVAILEYITRKGEEPASHTHHSEDEMFYILEGALTFRCGGEIFKLEKGSFIFLPHGIEHSYEISGQESVRLIVITAPVKEHGHGGWGGFVSDLESGQGELIAKP